MTVTRSANFRVCFLTLLALFSLLLPASAATLNVPSQYTKIQDAVNAAANGDTVLVAAGTYSADGNRDIDFLGKSLTVMSSAGAASTIIDCGGTNTSDGSGNHRGFYLHSGETNAVISGFTVKNGYETSVNGIADSACGGGVFINNSGSGTITLTNCIVSGNTVQSGDVDSSGGGVYNRNSSNGTIMLTNCAVSGNTAQGIGAGGGGVSNEDDAYGIIALTNCALSSNTAKDYGNKGVYSDHYGGGVLNEADLYGSITLAGCAFTSNSAQSDSYGYGYGGGEYNEGDVTLDNCTFAGNTAQAGSGVFNSTDGSGTITVINCTFHGNVAHGVGAVYNVNPYDVNNDSVGTIVLTNDILYGDSGGETYDESSGDEYAPSFVTYCDVQGNYSGTGNINADPMFVNDPTDLHIQPGSPCLGKGTPNQAPSTDKDGNPRPNPPSIGAYEVVLWPVNGLILSPSTVYGGAPAYGEVTLAGPAPDGGETVSLTSSSASVTVPATVTVPGGSASTTFALTTAAVTTDTPVTLTASGDGASTSAALTLLPKYTVSGTVTKSGSPLSGATVSLGGTGSFLLTKNLTTVQAIPDNSASGITQSLVVTDIGTISDLKLGVNITHPNIGNLVVTLTGPDGTSVVVHNQTGGNAANLVTDYPVLTVPDASLSAFNGKPTNGTWTLKVQDLTAGNTGNLNAWDLTFTFNGSVSKSITTDSSGNYSFGSLKPATYSVMPSLSGLTFSPASKVVTVGPSQSGINFAGYPLPVVSSFTPSSGQAGTVVTVTGNGFTGATSVVLHGTPMSFTVDTDTTITATVPSGATSGHIDVATPGGTAVSPHNFTVIIPPVITSLSPTSAYAGGSSLTLTVNGTGFVSGAVVKFGSTALATTFVSGSQLTATITSTLRAIVGVFPVTVVNPGNVTSNAANFSLKPRLTALTLFAARVSGGQSVTATVTLNGPAPTGGIAIALSSSDTTRATLPASVTIPAGVAFVTFPVTTAAVTTSGGASLTASGAGGTLSIVLTVLAPLTPSADTFGQDGSSADSNFGTVNPLLVKTASSPGTNRDTYLQFSLAGFTSITSARLLVTASLSGSGSLTTGVFGTSSGWTESGLTWNNRPALGSSLGSVTVTSTGNAVYSVDVTSYVQSQLGGGVTSFGLHNPSVSTLVTRIVSRELSTGAAQLVVTGN